MIMNRFLIIAAAVMVVVASAPAWSSQQPVTTKPLSINQLAAKPDAYVGKVAVVGRVASATPGKGFTLIDSINCATCTTECLTDKATKKIPFLWSGAAPAVKDVVRVEGALAKTAKGYIFTAERVIKQ
jgi:hypothetical protein